jgi:heptaprenyl diphosphate synthase
LIQSPGRAEYPRRVSAASAGGYAGRRGLPLLGAFCLFLSTIEYLIPKPLPFMRIGLANLPLMLALDIFPPGAYFLLVLIKVLGQAIVTGTLFSYVFLFSLAGSFASALCMFALRRIPGPGRLSLAGIGVAGAMLSNGTQLILARFLVFGPGVRFLIPPFLAAGLVTGLALGLFCERFRSRSRWYASRVKRPVPAEPGIPAVGPGEPGADAGRPPDVPAAALPEFPAGSSRRKTPAEFPGGKGLVLAGLLMAAAFLLNPSLPFRAAQFLFFWLCALAAGRKQRPLLSLSVIAAVVLVNLLAPYGRVLAEIGPLKITGGSLAAGLLKGISLEGLLMLSGAVISSGALDSLSRPGHAGGTSGPENGGLGTLLGESFRLFGKIGEKKGRVKVNRVIEGIDALLLELEEEEAEDTGERKTRGGEAPGKRRGRLLLFLGTPLVIALTLLAACRAWGFFA